MVRCIRASTVTTRMGHSPAASARRIESRACSHCRETTAALWKVNSRAGRVRTASPVRAPRSFAMRPASPSSAQITTMGRSCSCRTPAATWARWTGDSPVNAAGQAALSMAAVRLRNSSSAVIMETSCFMALTSNRKILHIQTCKVPPISTNQRGMQLLSYFRHAVFTCVRAPLPGCYRQPVRKLVRQSASFVLGTPGRGMFALRDNV